MEDSGRDRRIVLDTRATVPGISEEIPAGGRRPSRTAGVEGVAAVETIELNAELVVELDPRGPPPRRAVELVEPGMTIAWARAGRCGSDELLASAGAGADGRASSHTSSCARGGFEIVELDDLRAGPALDGATSGPRWG